jgi:CBS domain-containing protein
MHAGLVTCSPELTVGEIAACLVEHRVHALVVLEHGRAAGVVSDTDLLAGEWLATDDESLAVMRALTARDLMTGPPATVEADAEVADAARLLRGRHLGRLIVLDGGSPAGVISTSDLVRALGRPSARPRTVREAMSRAVLVCREDTTVGEAARAMHDRRVRSLVVVSGGRAVGVVTGHDLLRVYDSPTPASLGDLMHDPITVSADASLREAADLLLAHEIPRLLVTDPADPGAMPLGILSTADVVAEMAEPGSVWR